MKKLSLIMAALLCFLSVIPVSASETASEEIKTRYICDANGDGAVTAADARIILRHSVGLIYTEGFGWMDYNDIIYCDADKSGAIDAADARVALRTAVKLEEAQGRAFTITDSLNPSCEYEAYVKAVCSLTGDTVNITVAKNPHDLSQEQICAGGGYCSVCKKTVAVTPVHDFDIDKCQGVKRCIYCRYEEHFKGGHEYSSSSLICRECSESVYDEYEDFLIGFIKKNGEKISDASDRTAYIYEESDEYFVVGLIFYPDENGLYVYSGMAVDAEGEIVYNESYFSMKQMKIEVISYTEEALLANSFARVDVPLLKNGTGNGVTVIEYWSVPEFQEQKEQYGIISASMALMSCAWLKDLAERTDFTYSDILFSNNPEFR